ncbi:acetoacetate decarboxylase [Aliiruegeria haliotis]|uniref:Acetoacetate decarboxylase n=1 Tax=Aliiruegeria haliotis TaxID=1280846 RepID=A0A2T0RY60_9RHOB|nr:NAD(P)-binding protein [Aliiruegeria haliotis]PRY26119.1 acetoacetate decarboxylase [Aliiruegeria haliotis]
MTESRKKVAVLGGGVGAVTAAFALTATEEDRARHDVTIYQMGWRLGGKGASGRSPDDGQRIEEHGLHVWSGFYDNAIEQMKACLGELKAAGETRTYTDWKTAFTPHNNIALGDERDRAWDFWPMEVAENDAKPGSKGVYLAPAYYIEELVSYLAELLSRHGATVAPASDNMPQHITAHVGTRVGDQEAPLGETALHWLKGLLKGLPGDPARFVERDFDALRALGQQVQSDLRAIRAAGAEAFGAETLDDDLHKARVVLDLGGTVVRGMIADEVMLNGFDSIDGEEISQWLARHGARPETVDSPLVRAVYDYAFGFRQGMTDRSHRAIAAGTFLHGSFRLFFTYKKSIFFKMNAGMGDTIFTPYYYALKRRGVKFRFFHKVTELKLDAAGRAIETIAIDRQATVKAGDYEPFVSVKGLDCWPSEPLYDQLEEGAELKARKINLESSWTDWAPVEQHTLRRGVDFDEVVLGISIGALPALTPELAAASPSWRRMLEKVETAATQAMQLWMKPTVGTLAWPNGNSILTAYADDMNTWADMTHLDPAEDWPEAMKPGSIAYFCGPLADPEVIPPFSDTGFPERARAQVREASRQWMARHGADIWPDAFDTDGKFDESMLISEQAPGPGGMWETQYFRANYEPTERYVLSVPGSTSARLRADRSGFANLWLAGDWTFTAINAGCVEAATMSGLRAAAGLAGKPVEIIGELPDPVPYDPANGPKPMRPTLRSVRPQNSGWPWSAVYGMAQTTGPIVTLPFPRATVAAMLPEGLELDAQDVTGPEEHPVILLFGRQRNVRPNLMPFGWNYCEFICAVPWVRHTDPSLQDLPPLLTPIQLYLDALPPILLGRYGYGYPKTRAAIHADLTSYIIRDERSGEELISCQFVETGAKVPYHSVANLAAVRPGYEMAMVTRNRVGQWQYSIYDLSLGQAMAQPLKMEIRVSSPALGLPVGDIVPPDITGSPFGGVFLTADATINNPLQSWALRRLLEKESG